MDNIRVGEATASLATPHHIVHRLCELDMHIAGDMDQTGLQQGVGFEFKLPEISQGRHQVHTCRSAIPSFLYRSCFAMRSRHMPGRGIVEEAAFLHPK